MFLRSTRAVRHGAVCRRRLLHSRAAPMLSRRTTAVSTAGVTNPAPAAVYQSQRTAVTGSSITYTLPGLTAGTPYSVRLHFAELFFKSAGQRVFNVSINGASVLRFRYLQSSGGAFKAIVQTFVRNGEFGRPNRHRVYAGDERSGRQRNRSPVRRQRRRRADARRRRSRRRLRTRRAHRPMSRPFTTIRCAPAGTRPRRFSTRRTLRLPSSACAAC